MKNGYSRFEYYLVKLETLLLQAENEKNPALWLYSHDARTPLFMLESLAKLYESLHNKNRFSKLREDFKLLEDSLGAIDYYDCFAKEFLKNERIPDGVTEYLQAQAREKIQHLNELLQERGWTGNKPGRIQKIRKKLADADWLKDDKEVKALKDFYKDAISEIKDFAEKLNYNFTEMESQVHELRRKLRWLSIYPQALQGVIQLTKDNLEIPSVQKYLVPEIVNSSFNKMPATGANAYVLLLEKDYFFSLSWMIAELGKLKDNGLRVIIITEALQQLHSIDHDTAEASAYQLTSEEQPGIQAILSQSSALARIYFSENNLDKLVVGIEAAGKQ